MHAFYWTRKLPAGFHSYLFSRPLLSFAATHDCYFFGLNSGFFMRFWQVLQSHEEKFQFSLRQTKWIGWQQTLWTSFASNWRKNCESSHSKCQGNYSIDDSLHFQTLAAPNDALHTGTCTSIWHLHFPLGLVPLTLELDDMWGIANSGWHYITQCNLLPCFTTLLNATQVAALQGQA